jgi:hypothetical protein
MKLKNEPVIEMNKMEENVLTHFSEMLELYCSEMGMCLHCDLCEKIKNSNATDIIEDILSEIKIKIVDDIINIEGHWDKTAEDVLYCSVCKIPSCFQSNYCPNCGTKMRYNG